MDGRASPQHLADARGILRAEGDKGYAKLYAPEPHGGTRLSEPAICASCSILDERIAAVRDEPVLRESLSQALECATLVEG